MKDTMLTMRIDSALLNDFKKSVAYRNYKLPSGAAPQTHTEALRELMGNYIEKQKADEADEMRNVRRGI